MKDAAFFMPSYRSIHRIAVQPVGRAAQQTELSFRRQELLHGIHVNEILADLHRLKKQKYIGIAHCRLRIDMFLFK